MPGAGKTTLVEILAAKAKAGHATGRLSFPSDGTAVSTTPRIGFVPQQDILPPMLTVSEAQYGYAFPIASQMKKNAPVLSPLWRSWVSRGSRTLKLDRTTAEGREALSIGFELVAKPDVLILDESTSSSS
jgi:ABC-type multidrug transport system ATPase subunit